MYSVKCLEFRQVQCIDNSTVHLSVVVFTPPICDCGICAHAALLPAVEEAKVQANRLRNSSTVLVLLSGAHNVWHRWTCTNALRLLS
jgi:MinD superfamily P-loop ATPase